jgi:c(7)-type cytochrome triheme protein
MIYRTILDFGGMLARYCVYGVLLPILFYGSNQIVLAQVSNDEASVIKDQQAAGSNEQLEAILQPSKIASGDVVDPTDASEYVGEMYQLGLGWHPAGLEGFPTDKFGLVDWVATLDQELIHPRRSIDANAVEGVPFDMDILMPSKTGMIAGAHFPHKIHTTWLGCESCHIKIFIPLAGANDLTMSTIVEGKACGICHGKVAFPLNDCNRCHVRQAPSGGDKTGKQ